MQEHNHDLVQNLILKVLSREGYEREFDLSRIRSALEKAFRAAEYLGHDEKPKIGPETLAREVWIRLFDRYPHGGVLGVEEIQDLVEQTLVENGLYAQSKVYMVYRSRQSELRKLETTLLNIEHTMDGYLGQSDWRVKENANVNYSLGGLILHNSGAVTANYWLNKIYTPEIEKAHRTAAFHIHDLSMFSGYCAGWSLRQLILEGLGGVPGKISSAPAKHLNTLVQQMVNFLGVMQNEWAGAQAFSSFDTYLAPFVREDELKFEEVKQALQSFIYGVNTPSRWGSQAPFTNITLDWVVPSDLAETKVVVGGNELDYCYNELKEEMDLINRAFLELMIEGDASGRGFQYPIPTYNLTPGFGWDTENARLLFQMTGKYGTPYFQNFVNSDLNPSDVRSMCCRLQLDKRELRKRGGGLFGSDEFTGSIGVVTINLPQIGFLSKDKEDFYNRLGVLMDLASASLEIKRRIVEKLLDQGLFPYTRRYLQHLDNHFATIGIVGMNEALLNFLQVDLLSKEGYELALEVLEFMRSRLSVYQEKTGNLYNLEASPAEGTSYRLARHDITNYPGILTAGTTDEPYYTNSSQLPVDGTTDIFDALDHQDQLQTLYTGGTVFHGFLGEAIDDWTTCANLVKAVAKNYRLPYFTLSPTFSICQTHGYLKGEQTDCPICKKETEVYSRIVGYYRSLKNWNIGKKREFIERTTFSAGVSTPVPVIPKAHSVEVFFTPNCPKCPGVKTYLDLNGIAYREIDASTQQGQERAFKGGIYNVPTIVLKDSRGKEITRSSDPSKIKNLLAVTIQS